MDDQDRFIKAERMFIEKAKYLEGLHLLKDPGNKFVIEWVQKFAEQFREKWHNSVCKDCAEGCAHECRSFCERFQEAK
jgi:hypothetical protein